MWLVIQTWSGRWDLGSQPMPPAFALALDSAGSSIPARIAMIAITTSSSISVNAAAREDILRGIVQSPSRLGGGAVLNETVNSRNKQVSDRTDPFRGVRGNDRRGAGWEFGRRFSGICG